MEEREYPRIIPDLEVFDADDHKVGTVAHVYERGPATESAAALTGVEGAGAAAPASDGVFEMKTGLFGLGKHYFIPFSAVKDVTVGGVFLNRARADFDTLGWQTKPDFVTHPERMEEEAAAPGPGEVAQPVGAEGGAAADWDAVEHRYRMRWSEHYGAHGAQWETYQPRYRFAWEMSQRPEYRDLSWVTAQPELRRHWEVLYPDKEWDTVAETIRDAWEHPPVAAGSPNTSATGATSGAR